LSKIRSFASAAFDRALFLGAVCGFGIALVVMFGCVNDGAATPVVSPEQLVELRESAATERDRQLAIISEQQAAIDAAVARGDFAAAEAAKRKRDEADKAVKFIDQTVAGAAIAEATFTADGGVNVSPAAVAVGTAVGGPVGAGIAIGLPLIFGIFTDAASVQDPAMSAALDAKWASTVEPKLTPLAKSIVDAESLT
jgi:hypothetical protein